VSYLCSLPLIPTLHRIQAAFDPAILRLRDALRQLIYLLVLMDRNNSTLIFIRPFLTHILRRTARMQVGCHSDHLFITNYGAIYFILCANKSDLKRLIGRAFFSGMSEHRPPFVNFCFHCYTTADGWSHGLSLLNRASESFSGHICPFLSSLYCYSNLRRIMWTI
jgi:hypothetical protein